MKHTWQWSKRVKLKTFIMGLFFVVGLGPNPILKKSWGDVETLQKMSLQGAIEKAKENNAELRKLDLMLNSSSWKRLEVMSEHLPHLSFSGSRYLGLTYLRQGVNFAGQAVRLPAAFPTTLLQLDASWTVFDGLETINKYRAALFSYEAAELDYSHAKFLLERNVRIQFYQALAARELDYVADQNIQTLKQHLDLAQAGERIGTGTLVDVLRIESQLEEALAEKILTNDNVILNQRALNEVIGIEENIHVLEGALPELNEKKLPSGLQLNLAQREDFQAQVKKELAQDRLNAAAASFWLPKVSFFFTKQFYEFGNFDPVIIPTSSFQNAYSLGVRFSWNIFDGGSSIAKKALADNLAQQVAETTRQQKIVAPNDFETWKRRYTYHVALYRARQRSVKKSEESVRLATIAVKAGAKTHSDVLDAELDLFRARAGVIQAQLGAVESFAKLELALGQAI